MKDISFNKPKLRKHPRLIWLRLVRAWPLLFWLLAVALVLVFFEDATRLNAISGVAETREERIAPLETARLTSISVTLGARVEANDVLAQMDTSLMEARAAAEEARLLQTEGTLQNNQQRVLEFVREFETAIQSTQEDFYRERLLQSTDQAVLAALAAELQRLRPMLEAKLITEQAVAALLPQVAALEEKLKAYPELVKIQEDRLADAQRDLQVMRELLAEPGRDAFDLLTTIQRKKEAAARILKDNRQRIARQREEYTLRATRPAIVAEIYHQPGEVVQAGDPVLRLVYDRPTRVIGFLPEDHLGDLTQGQSVWVTRESNARNRVEGTVEAIAPDVQALPGRISPIRGQAVRGRRIYVQFDVAKLELVPGETVLIEDQPTRLGRLLTRLRGKGNLP